MEGGVTRQNCAVGSSSRISPYHPEAKSFAVEFHSCDLRDFIFIGTHNASKAEVTVLQDAVENFRGRSFLSSARKFGPVRFSSRHSEPQRAPVQDHHTNSRAASAGVISSSRAQFNRACERQPMPQGTAPSGKVEQLTTRFRLLRSTASWPP